MKQKSFIKEKSKEVVTDLVNKTIPAVERPVSNLKRWTQNYPRASLAIMLTIVIINVLVLFFFTNSFTPVSFSIKNIKQTVLDSTGSVSDMGIPFSFKNYREMNSIKDSLEYLISKPTQTASDTALAMRLFKKMEALDPDFFNKIKKLQHEKDSKPR